MPKVVPEYKEKARQRIIKAAARVFAKSGYNGTTMDDIAKELGVSKGAIYQYFKSKQNLFFEVMESMMDVQKDEVMSIILSDDPMYIASEEFFETKINRAIQTRSFSLDLLFEAARNEILKKRITQIYDRSYVEVLGLIEELKKKGIVKRNADVGVVWRGLIALRDGLISSIFIGGNTSEAKRVWNEVATILLKKVLSA